MRYGYGVSRLVVLLHVRDEDARGYGRVLGCAWRAFWWGSGLPAYDENSGLAAQYPTLKAFLEDQVPEWVPGCQLVLVAHSAGGRAPLAWMRNPADRELVSALFLLDCLYEPCNLEGVLEYGRLAVARPSARSLLVSYAQLTSNCALRLARQLETSPAVKIWAPGGTHRSHARVVGPEQAALWLRPRLKPSWVETAGVVVGVLGMWAATLILVKS
jgi:hypothetical protein